MLAEAGGGGGSISVEPATLDAMAGQIAGVAGSASATRGNLGGAASAAAGCAGPAAGSFARLQELLAGGLSFLADYSDALGRDTSGAAQAYVATDNGQM
jgi:uncharacterized protein YukE